MIDPLRYIQHLAKLAETDCPNEDYQTLFQAIESDREDPAFDVAREQFYRFLAEVHRNATPDVPPLAVTLASSDGTNQSRILDWEVPARFSGLRPGTYRLSLATGLPLWAGELPEAWLIWGREDGLPMVAATTDEESTPTATWTVAEGRLDVGVYPDLESGTLVVCRSREKP